MLTQGLVAVWLLGGATYCSHGIASAALPGGRTAERWSVAVVVGVAGAIATFQLLAALGAFAPAPASLAVGLWSLLALALTRSAPWAVLSQLARDVVVAARFVVGDGSLSSQLVRALLAALAMLVLPRALILPPLAWDSLTYHAVKAAMWVQSGGALPLELPGGWALYRHYPPGGEILGAWAMLPFHDDTLYLLTDVALWLLWIPVLVSLLREAGVHGQLQLPVCLYLMCVPAIYYWMPAGYVELPLYLMTYAGLWAVLRAGRGANTRAMAGLATLALATAVTIKITALPILAVAVVATVAPHVRARRHLRDALLGVSMGAAASVFTLGALLARNVVEQGHPFSPYPVAPLGITLGVARPELMAYSATMLEGATPDRELVAALQPFGLFAGLGDSTLGVLAPFWIAAALAALVPVLRTHRRVALTLLAVALVQLALYLSPGFRAVRLSHGLSNGRFLHAFLALCIVLALVPLASAALRRGAVLLLVGHALVICVAHAAQLAAPWELPAIALGSLAALLALVALPWCGRRFGDMRSGGALLGVLVLGLLVLVAPLRGYRDAHRQRAIATSVVGHRVPEYWKELARAVDEPERPHVLAVAQAPYMTFSISFLYHLLGRRLQNRLEYVSIRQDGRLPIYDVIDPVPEDALDAEAWVRRLDAVGVDHVVMMWPPFYEQLWMQQRPQRFERVAGNAREYGVYRVKSVR